MLKKIGVNGFKVESALPDGWATTPAKLCGVVNNAIAIYFRDATMATAFVTKWCAASNVEISEEAFRVWEDWQAQRNVAGPHKTF